MKTSKNIEANSSYESPIVKLIEFEVEVGFAASALELVEDITGIEGTIWTASPGNTY